MANYKKYLITPNTKPRMTRRDKWDKRPCVLQYRAFSSRVKELGITIPHDAHSVVFVIPMPLSWSKAKKNKHRYQKHQQTPDLDNLDKALLDAVFPHKKGGDSMIWNQHIAKIWGDVGMVLVGEIEPPPMDAIIFAINQQDLPGV